MHDVMFVFPNSTLRKPTRYQAARSCALYPLYKDRATNASELIELIGGSISERRDWLEKMMTAGWGVLQDPNVYQFARNCPPVGLNVPSGLKHAHLCKRPFSCEHCWARKNVLDKFIWFETLMTGSLDPNGPDGKPKVPPPGVFVLSYITRRKLSLVPKKAGRTATGIIRSFLGFQKPDLGIEGPWRQAIRNVSGRRLESNIHNAAASFMTHRIDFTDGPALLLDRCGVLLTMTPADPEIHRGMVAAAFGLEGDEPGLNRIADVRNHGLATKANLAKAFMHALYYPAGIIRHPDLDQTIALFDALALKPRLRMSASYGPSTQEDFFKILGLDLQHYLEMHHGPTNRRMVEQDGRQRRPA